MNLFIFFYTVVSLFVVPRACRPVATKIFIRSRKDNSSLSQSCSKSLSKHGASAPSTLKVQRTPTWPPPERPPVCRSRRTRLKSRRLALRPLRYLVKEGPSEGATRLRQSGPFCLESPVQVRGRVGLAVRAATFANFALDTGAVLQTPVANLTGVCDSARRQEAKL